jgi:hypothetical protein
MTLSYDNILDAVSESPEQALLDKKCSELMINNLKILTALG